MISRQITFLKVWCHVVPFFLFREIWWNALSFRCHRSPLRTPGRPVVHDQMPSMFDFPFYASIENDCFHMTYILGMGSTLNRWFPASCWTVKLLAQGITAVTPWASVFQFWSTPTAAHLKWRHTKTIFLMVWIVHIYIYIVSYSTTFLTSTKTSCNTYVFADAVLSFPFAKLVCLSTSCYKPRSYRSFVRIWRNWTSAKSAWALTTWRSDEKIPRSDMKWHSMTDLQLRCQFTYHWYYRWYNIAAIAIEELLWSVRSSYIFDMGSAVSPNVSCGFQNLRHNVRFAVRMDLWTFSFSFRVLKCPQTWCFIISFRIGIAIFWVSPI